MKSDSPQAKEVRAEIDRLIESATSGQFEILDHMYHEDMKIYLFDADDNLHISDKEAFKKHVIESTRSAPSPNISAKYHVVEADEANGHVLISRKVNLTGKEQLVTLSIDLVFEAGRWQITREVIFVRQGSQGD